MAAHLRVYCGYVDPLKATLSFCYICSLKSFSIKHEAHAGLFTCPAQTEQQLNSPMPRRGRVTLEHWPGLFSAVRYPWPYDLSCR